jgi:hypothetical protein
MGWLCQLVCRMVRRAATISGSPTKIVALDFDPAFSDADWQMANVLVAWRRAACYCRSPDSEAHIATQQTIRDVTILALLR